MKLPAILFIILGLYTNCETFGQDSIQPKKERILYTFAINCVPDKFDFPLIGFVNLARGNHKSAQIGFLNTNQNNFTGAQTGLFNNVGGFFKGAQTGLINNVDDFFIGAQIGLINNTNEYLIGAQIGFINKTGDSLSGIQLGFVNSVGDFIKGPQIGFANKTKILEGFQLGFVNYSDSVLNGIPLGFVSIVKKGGYQAIEMSITEMYPINISFKSGIRKLYTSLLMSFNPELENKFAIGLGVGSIRQLSQRLYLNPELASQYTFTRNNQQLTSLSACFGYTMTRKVHILTGPSLIWEYNGSNTKLNNPFFSILKYDFNNRNRLILGFRIALRYTFNKDPWGL